ncbi:hypothetical protein B0H19DRAFT_166217 [Mycena capillaripes]|nr:hypothetical protein B0H19DRAFT_166217 [Mycena capillaripes]
MFSKLFAILGVAALAAHALPQSESVIAKRAFSAFSPVARSLHASRILSPSMAGVLEARDELAARCVGDCKRCFCKKAHLVDRFFEIAEEAIAARVCDGCCGDNCTCLRSNDLRCIGTEEEFVNRAYEEAKRHLELTPRMC